MTSKAGEKSQFTQMLDDYKAMQPGSQAELRRVATPDALLLQPAFYRLTHGQAWEGLQRVVFMLPHVKNISNDEKLSAGRSFALADDGGAFDADNKKDKLTPVGVRLNQILRLDPPHDLVQLRRLVVHLEPVFNWERLANSLDWWSDDTKKKLIEQYFRARYTKES